MHENNVCLTTGNVQRSASLGRRQSIQMLLLVAVLVSSNSSNGQEYKSSITATEFDFITEDDPSLFTEIKYVGAGQEEMPDKRSDDLPLFQQAHVFDVSFSDGTKVRVVIDADFGSREEAKDEALRYVDPLGKLPTVLRQGVRRLVVHQGGKKTTAFSDQGLIVVYSENASERIATHDLEETIFHESVHATWDKAHAQSERWKRAQASDPGFATLYAKSKPNGEDLAESAIFAFALLHHADRLPEADAKKIAQTIPNRIQYIAELLPPGKPLHFHIKSGATITPPH